jgi:hypothetical protein
LVGRNVPVTIGSGTGPVASSSNLSDVVVASGAASTSDISMTAWPCGPTSMASMSSGRSWVSASRTVTFPTARVAPETVTVDGYGVDEPESGIAIEPPLKSVARAGLAGSASTTSATTIRLVTVNTSCQPSHQPASGA